MILYIHHHCSEWRIKHLITDGHAEIEKRSAEVVKLSGTTSFKANLGGKSYPGAWRGLFVMDLETGQVIHAGGSEDSKEEAFKHSPWLNDPTIRAIKVAEFLAEKQKL